MTNRRIPQVELQDTTPITTKDTTKGVTQVTHRLSSEAYAEFERLCGPSSVNQHTTEMQVGHQLGVQHALGILRRGFVTGA